LTFVDVYKTYHNELPKSQQIMFKRYDPTHGTRQKETFDSHHVRTITNSLCISVYGIRLWNVLEHNHNKYV